MSEVEFDGRRYEKPVSAPRPVGEVSPFAPLDYIAGQAGLPRFGRLLDELSPRAFLSRLGIVTPGVVVESVVERFIRSLARPEQEPSEPVAESLAGSPGQVIEPATDTDDAPASQPETEPSALV